MAKRSVTIAGHRTSVSLEAPFWDALAEIAAEAGRSQSALIVEIDRDREPSTNLSAAIRLFILSWYRARANTAASAADDSPA